MTGATPRVFERIFRFIKEGMPLGNAGEHTSAATYGPEWRGGMSRARRLRASDSGQAVGRPIATLEPLVNHLFPLGLGPSAEAFSPAGRSESSSCASVAPSCAAPADPRARQGPRAAHATRPWRASCAALVLRRRS